LAPLCQNLQRGAYWMPRLKRGMTTREIGEESSRPMRAFPDLLYRLVVWLQLHAVPPGRTRLPIRRGPS